MKNPIITIEMKNGDVIKAELYPEIAPETVNNFISLIKDGFYNGMGGPGYRIKGEFLSNGFKNDLKHEPGVLSMARAGHPDSAGSQFFIMHRSAPHLDGEYAAFGKVTEGFDVIDKIASVKTGFADKPVEPQIIKSITSNKRYLAMLLIIII